MDLAMTVLRRVGAVGAVGAVGGCVGIVMINAELFYLSVRCMQAP